MKKILSIDGGGIRGIIAGQILIALEKKLQQKSNNPNARLADYFDFFTGTSTGGILTCIYLCPDKDKPNQSKFSAEEAVAIYVQQGHKIFDLSMWQKVTSLDGIVNEKYSAIALENCLDDYFGNLKLSQLLKPCLIPAYDIERRETHFFAQHDYPTKGDGADFTVRDVCRATSAAPTYFEIAKVHSFSGVSYPLIDGSVFANNPALCAYSEVRNAVGNPTAKDMFIVSIGTGSYQKPYQYNQAKDWGNIGWVRPLIDIMMAGAAETTHYHLIRMFSAGNNSKNYIRIQPNNLRNAKPEIDDATAENIAALVEVGIETAENCPDLNRIVDVLLQGPDPVLFG